MIESAEQHIQAQAELMTKAGRWPALAEPTPLRRRHVLRLTHSVARNHQVMNPSVFGRTEAHMSHDREIEGQRERQRAAETKTEDKQSQVRPMQVPHSQSWWQSEYQQLWRQPELETNPELRGSSTGMTQFYCLCCETNRFFPPSFSVHSHTHLHYFSSKIYAEIPWIMSN